MSARLIALEVDARDPRALAAFWSRMLGRPIDASGTRLGAPRPVDFEVWFAPNPGPTSGVHRMHPDLTSASEQDQHRSVDLALALGARPLDVGQRGDEGHVVLADPEGNAFCVIEAGNAFLADTGRIGAMAGDGMPVVGYFWSQVLGWPLVWDQDEETAIQSPAGGTKITWGGPPVAPKAARNRMRWVVAAAGDLAAEVTRLVSLGAADRGTRDDGARELTDPEGNEFLLTATDPV